MHLTESKVNLIFSSSVWIIPYALENFPLIVLKRTKTGTNIKINVKTDNYIENALCIAVLYA